MTKRQFALTIPIALILAIGSLCLFSVMASGETSQHRVLIPSLSKKIPADMMLAHVPTTLDNARIPHFDTDVRDTEIAYTWYWIDLALRRKWRSGVRSEAECLSNVGERGDDAVVVNWSLQGVDFDIVDSRSLMVVIRKQGGFKETTLDAFKEFVEFDVGIKERIKVSSELIGKQGEQTSWGKIHVDKGRWTGWFNGPIEWYQADNALMLVFDKYLKPRFNKNHLYAEKLFGGASIDDPIPYLRFEKSNRLEHAELRLRLMMDSLDVKDVDEGDRDAVKGEARYNDNAVPTLLK